MLPGGIYMGYPSEIAKSVQESKSFHLELCWLESANKRQRLVRTFDVEGLAVSSTYFVETRQWLTVVVSFSVKTLIFVLWQWVTLTLTLIIVVSFCVKDDDSYELVKSHWEKKNKRKSRFCVRTLYFVVDGEVWSSDWINLVWLCAKIKL